MSISLIDNGNGDYSALITGAISSVGIRKQAVSKVTQKYSEFVELSVSFRRRTSPEDFSHIINLRVYSKRNADLALKLGRGTQVIVYASVPQNSVESWQHMKTTLIGFVSILLPVGPLFDCITEQMERKNYMDSLKEYRPGIAEIDYSGGEDTRGRDVSF